MKPSPYLSGAESTGRESAICSRLPVRSLSAPPVVSRLTAPVWYFPALGIGVLTTIIGFAVRYVAHLKQKREIEETKREAERR